MGFASALRKMAGGRIPPNDLESVTASLISGFADGTIELELGGWDLIQSIRPWLSRMGDPAGLWTPLLDSLLSVLEELVKKEPALTAVAHLWWMINTMQGVLDPVAPLVELEAAAQNLCGHERQIRKASYNSDYFGVPEEFNELSSLCQCMKKSIEVRLAFEARGFLLDVGLASSSLLRRANEPARNVCHELLYIVKRDSVFATHRDAAVFDAISYLLDKLMPAAIDAAFSDQAARLTIFENVVRATRSAHLHEAGVLRFVVSDRERDSFRAEDRP